MEKDQTAFFMMFFMSVGHSLSFSSLPRTTKHVHYESFKNCIYSKVAENSSNHLSEIEEMKKNAYDIKDGCTSDIEDLRKQFLYLEHYSRRENLKFLGIPERIISADKDDDRPSEDTKALVYKFMEDELAIENPQQKIEFQRIHRLGKSAKNGPRPILARFLRYSDREEVLQLARSKLKDSDFAVYEDIPKEVYDIRKAQMQKVKAAKKKGLKAAFSKAQPDCLFINGKFIPVNQPFF